MTHKALLKQLQISCLGLDHVDPLRLLVDDVIAALAQTEQEPVVGITAIRTWFKDGRVVTQTLCNSWVDTTPPQRTWVGLTDAEAQLIYDMGRTPSGMMEMVEAKLKEKNT
jgi:hypothetical protein